MVRHGPGVPVPSVIMAISSVLERTVTRNNLLGGAKAQPGTPFHGEFVLPIPIGKYLERLFWYTDCSFFCWVGAFLYLHRFLEMRKPPLILDSNTAQRILLPSVVMAVKFFGHVKYHNNFFAMAGGVSLRELNRLEREFLSGIRNKLLVTREEYYECSWLLQCELVGRPRMPLPPPLLIQICTEQEEEQEQEQEQPSFCA